MANVLVTPAAINMDLDVVNPTVKLKGNDFPTLTKGFYMLDQGPVFDPTHSTEFSSGHILTRPQVTSTIVYNRLKMGVKLFPESDYDLIEAWKANIRVGKTLFDIIHPVSGATWEVYLVRQIQYTINPSSPVLFNIQFEVIGEEQ